MKKIGPIAPTKLLFKCFEQSKTRHFNNLFGKDVTENKRFWKTIKLFFIDKTKNSKTKAKNSNNSILTENYQTIREDEKI